MIASFAVPLASDAVFSPDGTKVAVASDNTTAQIWDVARKRQVGTLAGHAQDVESVAFSPDGSKIVTGSLDNTERIELVPVAGGWTCARWGRFEPPFEDADVSPLPDDPMG